VVTAKAARERRRDMLAIDLVVQPGSQPEDISVDAWVTSVGASVSPAHHACKSPGVVPQDHQGAATVSLTGVPSSIWHARAHHSGGDEVAAVSLGAFVVAQNGLGHLSQSLRRTAACRESAPANDGAHLAVKVVDVSEADGLEVGVLGGLRCEVHDGDVVGEGVGVVVLVVDVGADLERLAIRVVYIGLQARVDRAVDIVEPCVTADAMGCSNKDEGAIETLDQGATANVVATFRQTTDEWPVVRCGLSSSNDLGGDG